MTLTPHALSNATLTTLTHLTTVGLMLGDNAVSSLAPQHSGVAAENAMKLHRSLATAFGTTGGAADATPARTDAERLIQTVGLSLFHRSGSGDYEVEQTGGAPVAFREMPPALANMLAPLADSLRKARGEISADTDAVLNAAGLNDTAAGTQADIMAQGLRSFLSSTPPAWLATEAVQAAIDEIRLQARPPLSPAQKFQRFLAETFVPDALEAEYIAIAAANAFQVIPDEPTLAELLTGIRPAPDNLEAIKTAWRATVRANGMDFDPHRSLLKAMRAAVVRLADFYDAKAGQLDERRRALHRNASWSRWGCVALGAAETGLALLFPNLSHFMPPMAGATIAALVSVRNYLERSILIEEIGAADKFRATARDLRREMTILTGASPQEEANSLAVALKNALERLASFAEFRGEQEFGSLIPTGGRTSRGFTATQEAPKSDDIDPMKLAEIEDLLLGAVRETVKASLAAERHQRDLIAQNLHIHGIAQAAAMTGATIGPVLQAAGMPGVGAAAIGGFLTAVTFGSIDFLKDERRNGDAVEAPAYRRSAIAMRNEVLAMLARPYGDPQKIYDEVRALIESMNALREGLDQERSRLRNALHEAEAAERQESPPARERRSL